MLWMRFLNAAKLDKATFLIFPSRYQTESYCQINLRRVTSVLCLEILEYRNKVQELRIPKCLTEDIYKEVQFQYVERLMVLIFCFRLQEFVAQWVK